MHTVCALGACGHDGPYNGFTFMVSMSSVCIPVVSGV